MRPPEVSDKEIEGYVMSVLKTKRDEYKSHKTQAMIQYEEYGSLKDKDWERLYHRYVVAFDAAIKAVEEKFKK